MRSLLAIYGPLRDLTVQAVWVCSGIEDGSSIIDLLEFIDGREHLSKLYRGKERRAWR